MAKTCLDPSCTILTDGVCALKHHPAEGCPQYVEADEAIELEGEESGLHQPTTLQTPTRAVTRLYSGEGLTLEEANAAARRYYTKLVFLAGDVDSGKTTVIAELFNLFQRGPIKSIQFSGSQGMLGFERRCHLARTESQATKADTDHTKMGLEDVFLPLLVRIEQFAPLQIMLADLPGEQFKRAIESSEDARKLHYLARADHFTLLVDGARIVDGKTRIAAVSNGQRLLTRFIGEGLIGGRTRVEVVFSKWDLTVESKTELKTEEFVQRTIDEMSKRFFDVFASLSFIKLSARTRERTGLADLFSAWTVIPPPEPFDEPNTEPTERYMGRFGSSEGSAQ